jgi:hypothetical protein
VTDETWRKRVGVEPTGDRKTCRPPVLKTGTITGPHALPYLIINKLHHGHRAIFIHSLGSENQEHKPKGLLFVDTTTPPPLSCIR